MCGMLLKLAKKTLERCQMARQFKENLGKVCKSFRNIF